MKTLNYSDFVKNFDSYKGCSYRIVGTLNNKKVRSCWRKADVCDLAETLSNQIMKIIGIEIA